MRRWIIVAATAIGSLLLLIVVGWHLLLPMLVRHEVSAVFQHIGLADATFDLQSASPWQTSISKIIGGRGQSKPQLNIGTVTINYSPMQVLGGQITSVTIQNGRWIVPLGSLGKINPESGSAALPVDQIRLELCVLSFDQNEKELDLPLDATMTQNSDGVLQLDLNSSVGSGSIHLSGTIGLKTDSANLNLAARGIELEKILPLIATNGGDIKGNIDVNATHHRTAGKDSTDVRVESRQLTAAGQQLSDVVVVAQAAGTDAIKINDARLGWAGGAIWAQPFTYHPSTGTAEFVLKAAVIDLQQALDILAPGRAKASGKIDAEIPLKITGWPRVVVGDGWIATDGAGTIQLSNSAELLGPLLNQGGAQSSDGSDMSQIREKILNALSDFQFNQIQANFQRTNDGQASDEIAAVHIVGKGRTGSQQELDIQLNIRGVEKALNAYLSTRALVFNLGKK